jgi:hypothetical protein
VTKYAPQLASVVRTLAAKGRTVTLRHVVSSDEFNPVTDQPAELDTTEVQVSALVTPPTTMTEQAYADQFKAGTMVRSRTRNVLWAAKDTGGTTLPFSPQEGDQLDFDGYTWELVGVRHLAPDGTPLFWAGTCKR